MMSEKHADIYLKWNSLLIQKDISPDKVDSEYVEFSREYNHAFWGNYHGANSKIHRRILQKIMLVFLLDIVSQNGQQKVQIQ